VYAIRYDWAAESDRLAWSVGADPPTTFLQDFLDEMETTATVSETYEDNITDLKDWMNRINRFAAANKGGIDARPR
jgi:hypothetical protein